ncbi:MAG: ParB N-terminal domain-containing protein [Bacteroides sp.]|nr:ParB N-terminal domain-containing protein [Prevotella sp.]MCM1408655.1 ParB N-terminal domain-containing protein [Treponema brennaborense]MCM1470516.1 ParB N-terminal domain-containing protein [Bacteroides sp.]
MVINIDSIKVKKRIRKDIGDLEPLKESMQKYGLMNPVTVNEKYELIAGERRLAAAKQLGWTDINAVVVNADDKADLLEMELEENVQRLPFTEEELLDGYAALKKLRSPNFFRRLWNAVKQFILPPAGELGVRKIRRAKKTMFLLPAGILLIIGGAVCTKNQLITPVLHTLLDICAAAALIVGSFSLVRVIAARRA